jgi:hypothetical protein
MMERTIQQSTQARIMLGMDGSPISVAVGLVYLAIIIGLTWRLLRRRKRYGPAATGSIRPTQRGSPKGS